jgi:hypothetical protein
VITPVVQRWRERRSLYRPAGEPIATRCFEVAPIDGKGADNAARAFVATHHYSGTMPAARRRYGLYRGGELVGVAVYSVPASQAVLVSAFGPAADAGVELGRLVLLDDVPANGESWFIARTFELLRHDGFAGVVSFSDPVPRTSADGSRVFAGHIGTIYQATNAIYRGRTRPETKWLLPDGRVLEPRAASKIRNGERGRAYAAGILERYGATPPAATEDAGAWFMLWRGRLCRPLRHDGNHRYLFALDRGLRRQLGAGQPYPKLIRWLQ